MDEFALFPCNIETNEATSTIISLETFGKLNILISRSLCNEKENFRFFKNTITFTFIDDYTLNSDNNKEI